MKHKNKLTYLLILSIFNNIGGVILAQERSAFEQKLLDLKIDRSQLINLSDSTKIELAQPNCAYINITGIDKMPWSKTDPQSIDMHAEIEIFDCNGSYFKKKVLMNAQGNSSMSHIKKNFSLDFCEDEWLGDATTSITIGKWVSQDSYHFKAYYLDYFRGTAAVGYRLFDQVVADHESYLSRAGLEDTGARCYPDGFPCIVYLNGEFQGVFAWQLKKHRKNMGQDKGTATHIHLDGTLGNVISGTTINWTQFEVRNPKSLYCTDTEEIPETYSYVKVNDEEELANIGDNHTLCDTKPSDFTDSEIREMFPDSQPTYLSYEAKKGTNYYKFTITPAGPAYKKYDGDYPTELIDETMPYYNPENKDHVLTAQVKHSIETLNQYYNELKIMENAGASDETMRSAVEERFDVEGIVDYLVFSSVTNNYDGFLKNWQWFTYDGVKWFVVPYDLDGTFGNFYTGTIMMDAYAQNAEWTSFTTLKFSTRGSMYFICKYFYDEIVERYNDLRESGVFTTGNIVSMFSKWQTSVGSVNYNDEWTKWPQSPCILETVINDGWSTEDSWIGYSSLSNYDANTEYVQGDRCRYKTRIWTATKTVKGVAPCTQIGYTDNIDRISNYMDDRLALADTYAKLTMDDLLTSYTLNITSAQWATICVPFSFRIPEGITLYSIEGVDDEGAFVNKQVANYTEANQPYLVNGHQGMYLLTGMKQDIEYDVASGATDEEIAIAREYALTNGLLKGTLEDIYVPKDKYVLQNQNGVLAFYHVSNDDEIMLSANRAYLSLPTTSEAKTTMYHLFDTADDIGQPLSESIDRVTGIYNATGISFDKIRKGINIIKYANGKVQKIIIK